MSRKLTAPLAALVVSVAVALALAGAAVAGPVTVALYSFQTQGDVAAFQKQAGAKCGKGLRGGRALGLSVGPGTNSCVWRTSVVGDSTDPGSDMELSALTGLGGKTSKKLAKKAYVAVGTRVSENSGWQLRVRPNAGAWQLFRDPKGAAGPVLFRAGKGKFIRKGRKPNVLLLRTFDYGTANTQVIAAVNRKRVVALTDSAADSPDGRHSVVALGAKGTGPGAGISAKFDNVAVKVPNPF